MKRQNILDLLTFSSPFVRFFIAFSLNITFALIRTNRLRISLPISFLKTRMKTVLTIQNPDFFVGISNVFWQNSRHLFKFQVIWLPDYKSHSKSGSGPFANQPLFEDLKSRGIPISDSHCAAGITIPAYLANKSDARDRNIKIGDHSQMMSCK